MTEPSIIPADIPAAGDQPIVLSTLDTVSELRGQVIRWLQHLPAVAEGLKKLAPTDTFHVIVSPENAKFFKRATDGTYKPFLRNKGRFIENVDLKEVSPDLVSAASSFLLTANMAAMAADLNEIKFGVRDLNTLISDSTRGEVDGAISALRQAKALAEPSEQRRETLGACRDLSTRLGKLAGQLKAHCSAMPEPNTGMFDGFLGSRLDEADAKWRCVEQDLLLLSEGLGDLLRTYSELGEFRALQVALSGVTKAIADADLPNAARKARLVRIPPHTFAPETNIRRFESMLYAVQQRLLSHDEPLLLPIAIDITIEELDICQPPDFASADAN